MPLQDSVASAAPSTHGTRIPFGRPTLRALGAACAIAAGGALAGAAATRQPLVAALLLLLCCGGCYAFVFARALPRAFLGVLGVVLLGYAFFGRDFAYLGMPPIFIGELTLALGVVAALASGWLLGLLRSPIAWLIIALALCGMGGTLPYVSTYRVDALRDAVLWGYGIFAFAVAACVLKADAVPAISRHYSRWLLAFVAWSPLVAVIGAVAPSLVGGGAGGALFPVKPGDVAVHLAGIAAFVLVGLDQETDDAPPRPRRLFWLLWGGSFLIVTALNRGGFLAITMSLTLLGILLPATIGRRLAGYAALAVAGGAVVLLTSMSVEDRWKMTPATETRVLAPRQVVENVLSITGRQSAGDLSNTRDWRLEWWKTIVGYTINGPYFWTGKGFGVNLADDDGFQVAEGDVTPLRSPHNSFMTVLARMGVPGIALWLILQLAFGVSLVRAFLRARDRGAYHWARLDLWILCYWVAFLVDSAFDVFLEGPQGGIWFWCVIGFGIAILELQRRDRGAAQLRWSAS